MASIFDGGALLLLFGFAVLGALLALGRGLLNKEPAGEIGKHALEAALAAFFGGLISRIFISVLLGAAQNQGEAGFVVGWAFFLWPGVVDTIAHLFGNPNPVLAAPDQLLWIATGVGALTGMMDGFWRTQPWVGWGAFSFLLDVTWGLAGATNGALVHLVNTYWGDHAADGRTSAHRYREGFRFMPTFAFTQGAVMSNLKDGPGVDLWNHETTHVWQNRIFGPLFTLTYLGWMVLLAVPGAIAGLVTKVGLVEGIRKWSYYNNFWEWWGYKNGGGRSGPLVWSDALVIILSIIYFIIVGILAVMVVLRVW